MAFLRKRSGSRSTKIIDRPNFTPGPEALLQRAILDWARYALPGVFVTHVEAGSPTLKRRRYLRWLGARAGFPDLLFIGPGKEPGFPRILCMEVKSKSGSTTENQKYVMNLLKEMGVHVAVVKSLEQAEEAVKAAGFAPRARIL